MNVLNQTSAVVDVEHLEAITDSKDRLLFGECVLEDHAVRLFSQEICGLRKTTIYGAIFAGFHVRRATRQHIGVKRWDQPAPFFLVFQADNRPFAASFFYGI